jgi:hypothetical protein
MNLNKKMKKVKIKSIPSLQKGGKVNNTGYTKGTSTESNPYNIIPSNQITMENVEYPVLGIPNNGNPILMLPDNNYSFPNSNYVTEIPMGQKGGKIVNKKVKIKSIPLAQKGKLIKHDELDLNLSETDEILNQQTWNNNNNYSNNQFNSDPSGKPIIETQSFMESNPNAKMSDINTSSSTPSMGDPVTGAFMAVGEELDKSFGIPEFTLNSSPFISAASSLYGYVDNKLNKKREFEHLSNQMRPVLGDLPVNQGLDMPMYLQEGGSINTSNNSLYSDNINGYTDNDFETPLQAANVIVEKGETVVYPDGGQTNINGDKHSDPSGGEYRNYPEGSRVFSKKLKASKELVKSLSGNSKGLKGRLAFADIVKKYNTDKENEIINNPNLNYISKQTAEINKANKLAKVDQIFDEQETVNGNKLKEIQKENELLKAQLNQQVVENSMGQIVDENQQSNFMKNGGRVKSIIKNIPKAQGGVTIRGGFEGRGQGSDYNMGYTDEQQIAYLNRLRNLMESNGLTWNPNDLASNQRTYFESLPDEVLFDYFTNQVPPTNLARSNSGRNLSIRDYQEMRDNGTLTREQLLNDIVDDIPGVRIPEVVRNNFNSSDEYMNWRNSNPELTENILIDGNFNNISNPKYHLGEYLEETERIQPNRGRYTQDNKLPNQEYIPLTSAPDVIKTSKNNSSNNKQSSIPKTNKPVKNNSSNKNRRFSSMFDYLPEMIAAGLNMNDYPIFTAKYQPKYMQREEMNIQPFLNRTFSQGQPLIEGVTGNASIDNARANQTLANIYAADNEMMANKFNFDTQNRQQVSNMNTQTENQANQFNIQNAIGMADRMAQRQTNKNIETNRITNSAYAKSKNIQRENRALNTANQLMLNNIQLDANGNPVFLPLSNINTQQQGNDFNAMYNALSQADKEKFLAAQQLSKLQQKTARSNNNIIQNENYPQMNKFGGKIKSKYIIKKVK